jgi:S1/P1 Nuclease
MRKALAAALVALALSAMPAGVGAWGFTGHKFITDHAVDLLPPEIRPFFQKYRTTLVEHSIDPDTYRTMGFVEEPPRHFLDMDAYGPFPFKNLAHDYAQAVAERGQDFVTQQGTLPWRAEEVYGKLREAFTQLGTRDYARDNVKLFASVLAHYVGDSYQPLHTCVNYDGQQTGQQGIHARFETELFDLYQDKLKVAPTPVTQISNVREFMFANLTDSFQQVEPILAADRAAVKGRTAYDAGYFAQMFEKTGPIMEQRISGAITAVASLVTSAWIEAGKPALPADTPPRPLRPIRR